MPVGCGVVEMPVVYTTLFFAETGAFLISLYPIEPGGNHGEYEHLGPREQGHSAQ